MAVATQDDVCRYAMIFCVSIRDGECIDLSLVHCAGDASFRCFPILFAAVEMRADD
jgi:hypothetical protein